MPLHVKYNECSVKDKSEELMIQCEWLSVVDHAPTSQRRGTNVSPHHTEVLNNEEKTTEEIKSKK